MYPYVFPPDSHSGRSAILQNRDRAQPSILSSPSRAEGPNPGPPPLKLGISREGILRAYLSNFLIMEEGCRALSHHGQAVIRVVILCFALPAAGTGPAFSSSGALARSGHTTQNTSQQQGAGKRAVKTRHNRGHIDALANAQLAGQDETSTSGEVEVYLCS